jgi:hypothetical protein
VFVVDPCENDNEPSGSIKDQFGDYWISKEDGATFNYLIVARRTEFLFEVQS